MITKLLGFLGTGFNLHYQLMIGGLLVIGAIASTSVAYNFGFNKGNKVGIMQEQERLNKEYQTILENKIKDNTINLEKQFKLQLEAERKRNKTKIEYKDRIIQGKKLINSTDVLQDPKCVLPKEKVDELNKLTGEIK